MYGMYLIKDAGGALLRKVYCPADEIKLQLSPDETAELVEPTVDGFGMVDPDGSGTWSANQ